MWVGPERWRVLTVTDFWGPGHVGFRYPEVVPVAEIVGYMLPQYEQSQ